MKTTRAKIAGVVLVVGLFAMAGSGCSTPATRIEANRAAFERLDPESQNLVKEGRVAIGFDRTTVKLALGEPDRIWKRTDKSGESESWSYTAYESDGGIPLYRGYWHRYYNPYPLNYPFYRGYGARKEREIFKVVFEGDEVVSVESES